MGFVLKVVFVSSWAQKYNLVFHERTLPEDQRSLIGLQARSREWRRNECFQVLKDRGINANLVSEDLKDDNMIMGENCFLQKNLTNVEANLKKDKRSVVFATAHHADDQHETVMLKFLRGAHISNLQPVRYAYVNMKSYECKFNLFLSTLLQIL